jgi:hypothetical protein
MSQPHVCVFNRECWCGAGPDTPISVGQSSAGWPRKSLAFGCLPRQIGDQKRQWAEQGVNVDYTPDGRAIVRDPGQQRDMMKVKGWSDLSREITKPKRKTLKERSIRPRPDRKFSDTL